MPTEDIYCTFKKLSIPQSWIYLNLSRAESLLIAIGINRSAVFLHIYMTTVSRIYYSRLNVCTCTYIYC